MVFVRRHKSRIAISVSGGPVVETGGRVAVAENANVRWGPGPWSQVGWASEVSTDRGYARFDAITDRRIQAVLAGVAFLVLVGLAWAGRRSE